MIMLDTKGDSLTETLLNERVVPDLRVVADALEQHAPDTEAAQRTRRVLALLATAEEDAGDLRELWRAVGYQMENNAPLKDCVRMALDENPTLAEKGSADLAEASRSVRTAEGVLEAEKRRRDRAFAASCFRS